MGFQMFHLSLTVLKSTSCMTVASCHSGRVRICDIRELDVSSSLTNGEQSHTATPRTSAADSSFTKAPVAEEETRRTRYCVDELPIL